MSPTTVQRQMDNLAHPAGKDPSDHDHPQPTKLWFGQFGTFAHQQPLQTLGTSVNNHGRPRRLMELRFLKHHQFAKAFNFGKSNQKRSV
jgi:hypothetical protein